MATITVQEITSSGLEATYAASNDGDVFANTGDEMLHVKNGSGGDITLTVTPGRTTETSRRMGSMTKTAVSVVITAGEERFVGPFEPYAFNNAAGNTTLNYSGVTSLTSAVFKFTNAN